MIYLALAGEEESTLYDFSSLFPSVAEMMHAIAIRYLLAFLDHVLGYKVGLEYQVEGNDSSRNLILTFLPSFILIVLGQQE